jgi:hypothetical protein
MATSAFAKISQPVASDKDLILINGVFPMRPSTPSDIFEDLDAPEPLLCFEELVDERLFFGGFNQKTL